jgi:hypothetical protein
LNVLEALRGLMQATAEGERMKLLGPDFRERQAASAQKLKESEFRMSREGREEVRQGRLDERQSLQDANAFAEMMVKLRSLTDSPQEQMPEGVAGPPAPIDPGPVEFTSPTGEKIPVAAPFRDDLAARARSEDDLASARRIAEKMELMRAENAIPLGVADRERIGLTEAGANRRAAMAADAARDRRTGPMSPQQEFRNTLDLSKQYASNTKAARLVQTQFGVMERALASAGADGALNPASQAVITTFNKIMDPSSVVRESEYARSVRGQSLADDIIGRGEALLKGGPGVRPESLAQYVALAKTFNDEQQESLRHEQARITSMAQRFGLDPQLVIGETGQRATIGGARPATHRFNPATGRVEAIR